jgi:hypothetical protein
LRATQHRGNGQWRIKLEDYDAWMQGLRPKVQPSQRYITTRRTG